MSEPLPLPITPFYYVSLPPYLMTWEWIDHPEHHIQGHSTSTLWRDLDTALRTFFEPSAPFGEQWSPERRVVVDARGFVIFGFIEGGHEHPYVMTAEVVALLIALGLTEGLDQIDLLDWELEMSWRSS